MKARMSAQSEKRMTRAVSYLQAYMQTYSEQPGYKSYSDKIFINDILYGLGVALGGKKYEAFTGFQDFKNVLREHLKADGK